MLVLIKGAGDLASGVAHRLYMSGFNIVMTDIEMPTTIRRTVSFSSAIICGSAEVEGVNAVLANNIDDVKNIINDKNIAVIVDEKANSINILKPDIVVDAIIAKQNLGTKKEDAPIVIGIGPGFNPKVDCHAAIESKRGHYLGKVLYNSRPASNTGKPGNICGYEEERIIRATEDGIFKPIKHIGDIVKAHDTVATINNSSVTTAISGVVRGMLPDNTPVHKGMKSGDVDPRGINDYCYQISDKARAIAGGVLEAILHLSGGINK